MCIALVGLVVGTDILGFCYGGRCTKENIFSNNIYVMYEHKRDAPQTPPKYHCSGWAIALAIAVCGYKRNL